MSERPREEESDGDALALTTGGITLLGVILSIGVSVGFGLNGAWWVRVIVGVATSIALLGVVKVGSSSARGPIARLAKWAINAPWR